MTDQKAVLVVDDNESSRYLLSHWLRHANYRVDEAETGAEALSAIASRSYELMLLDVNLPDMTGHGVCAAVKSDPVTRMLPVIHVSATAIDSEDRTAGLRGGADAYLVEPLERQELLATVEAVLRLSEARRRAETLAERLMKLHAASLELNAASDLETLAVAAARTARDLCRHSVAAAAFTDAGGALALPGPTPLLLPLTPEESQALAGSPEDALARLAPTSDLRGRSLSVFAARSRTSNATGLLLAETSVAGDEALTAALQQLTQTVGVAAENLTLRAREHHIAVTLQRSLLGRIPLVPWLDIAVRYMPSATQLEVGGDFYDVLQLDEDHVAVIIGDVEGHSLHSATVMAAIRNSLAAYLLAGRPPGVAIDLLDHVLQTTHPDTTATVCCVVLRSDGSAVIANGGHLPPIHRYSHAAKALPAAGLLLGAGGRRSETTHQFRPGDTLVQFTDGLIERRGESIADGLAAATAIIANAPADVEAICDQLLLELASATRNPDDIAIIAVRLAPPGSEHDAG